MSVVWCWEACNVFYQTLVAEKKKKIHFAGARNKLIRAELVTAKPKNELKEAIRLYTAEHIYEK